MRFLKYRALRSRLGLIGVALASAMALSACGGGGSPLPNLAGSATLNGQPLKGAIVALYSDSLTQQTAAQPNSNRLLPAASSANVMKLAADATPLPTGSQLIATTATGSDGSFSIPFSCQANTGYYVIVSGGSIGQNPPNPVLRIMAVVPTCQAAQQPIVVNESTTVGSVLSFENLLSFSGNNGAVVGILAAPSVAGAFYNYSTIINGQGQPTPKVTGNASANSVFQTLTGARRLAAYRLAQIHRLALAS